jgi:hypothetical protein
MRQKSKSTPASPEGVVRDIRRATRKKLPDTFLYVLIPGTLGGPRTSKRLRQEHFAVRSNRFVPSRRVLPWLSQFMVSNELTRLCRNPKSGYPSDRKV